MVYIPSMRLILATLIFFLSLLKPETQACTAFLLSSPSDTVVAKTMDWIRGEGLVLINKRHVQKQAYSYEKDPQPLVWTSQYMSLTFTMSAREFPQEGVNERGLSVHILVFKQSRPPKSDKPVLGALQWVQYILDTAHDLKSARKRAQLTNLSSAFSKMHFFVCESSGACEIFEYRNGRLKVHRDSDLPLTALTNDAYPKSLKFFEDLTSTKSREEILANQSTGSLDRFARAALWSTGFSGSQDVFVYGLHALESVNDPKLTQWQMLFDLKLKGVKWRTKTAPGLKFADLTEFDPHCSSPVQMLDLNLKAQGYVSDKFENYRTEANSDLIDLNKVGMPENRQVMKTYPETHTKCLENLL